MDKLTRNSIAALWEMLWTAGDSGTQRVAMDTMFGVMEASGITHKDVADWIRADRLEIGGMDGVLSKPEQEVERQEHRDMAKKVLSANYRKLHEKERKFLESVMEQIEVEQRFLSPKQKKWLFDLARKYGV